MAGLIEELRRRKVFRVAVVYVVVAWLLIQVVDVVLPTFNAPQWVNQTIILVLLLGLPVALVLAWAFELTPQGIKPAAEVTAETSYSSGSGSGLTSTAFAFMALAVGFLLVDRLLLDSTDQTDDRSIAAVTSEVSPAVRRSFINLGVLDRRPTIYTLVDLTLSADGRRLAYATYRDGFYRFYVRDLDSLESRLLNEVRSSNSNFSAPTFSPDKEQLAYYDTASAQVNTILVRGGQPQVIARGRLGSVPMWAEDQHIYFTNRSGELTRVPTIGGEEVSVGIPRETISEIQVRPQILSDGRYIMFTGSLTDNYSEARIRLFDLEANTSRILIEAAHSARYVKSGHIVFARTDALWAVPFDIQSMQITGLEVPVVEGVEMSDYFGRVSYTVSDDGLLAYINETTPQVEGSTLVWVDRVSGAEDEIDIDAGFYVHPQISHQGDQISVTSLGASGSDIWTYDIARAAFSPLTFVGSMERAIWSPDDDFFVIQDFANLGLWSMASNGSGELERISNSLRDQRPEDFSPDGKTIIYRDGTDGPFNMSSLSIDGERMESALTETSDVWEGFSKISPDGKWLAYTSNESGTYEVYVRAFPDFEGGGKWQVSNNTGEEPTWGPEGRELFYRTSDGVSVMRVAIDTSEDFSASRPELLFSGDFASIGNRPSYDVTADGQRFLMLKPPPDMRRSVDVSIVLVDNWFEELKRLAPPSAP